MSNGGAKSKFIWAKPQKKSFKDLKHLLCSTQIFTLIDLKQPFKIEKNALNDVVGAVLTQHVHLMAHCNETLLDVIHKYPTYDKEMCSMTQTCHQWKHYILGKGTMIHIDHKSLQFM